MWEQYEAPEEKRAKAAPAGSSGPGAAEAPLSVREEFAPAPIRAGGTRSGAGMAIGIVAFLALIGISVGVASSAEQSSEPDYSGFYGCVAAEGADGDNGLLSPAELCEIGNDVPPGYVDDEEYDPFGEDDSSLDDLYDDPAY